MVHTDYQSRLPALMTSPAQSDFAVTIDSSHTDIITYFTKITREGQLFVLIILSIFDTKDVASNDLMSSIVIAFELH